MDVHVATKRDAEGIHCQVFVPGMLIFNFWVHADNPKFERVVRARTLEAVAQDLLHKDLSMEGLFPLNVLIDQEPP